jgi:excisionase family DNA binding protein
VEPVLLRIQETAKLLKVSKWTIYRWIEEGRLRATKIGRGSLRVFRTSVDGLIEGTRVDYRETQDSSRSNMTPVRPTGRKKKR